MENSSINSFAKGSVKLKGQKIPGTLQPKFFGRHTVEVAQDLIGKILVVRKNPKAPLESPEAKVAVARIVETEAYRGDDPASHSCKGETPRSAIMFGEPGYAYVYFIYGMYEMLNFVTEKKGYPGAVLIRAVEPISGIEHSTNGPGKLCRAMGIEMSHKGQRLDGPALFVVEDGYQPKEIITTPRVGIRLASDTPWRFFEAGNRFVSKGPKIHGSK